MTWNPPPESERPDGYTCLGQVEVYWAVTEAGERGRAIWVECQWDAEEHIWTTRLSGGALVEPSKFAPLPAVAAAQIAELKNYVSKIEEAAEGAVEALRSTGSAWPMAAGKALKAVMQKGDPT